MLLTGKIDAGRSGEKGRLHTGGALMMRSRVREDPRRDKYTGLILYSPRVWFSLEIRDWKKYGELKALGVMRGGLGRAAYCSEIL